MVFVRFDVGCNTKIYFLQMKFDFRISLHGLLYQIARNFGVFGISEIMNKKYTVNS